MGVGVGCLLIILGVGIWWYLRRKNQQAKVAQDQQGGKPGGEADAYDSPYNGQQPQGGYPEPVPQNRLPPLGA